MLSAGSLALGSKYSRLSGSSSSRLTPPVIGQKSDANVRFVSDNAEIYLQSSSKSTIYVGKTNIIDYMPIGMIHAET